MTTKTLSGTYASGYTLAAKYSAVSVTNTGVVESAPGTSSTPNAGVALVLPNGGDVANAGHIQGGAGQGGYATGGLGGDGVSLSALGTVTNTGTIAGGLGGGPYYGNFGFVGPGSNGGYAVLLQAEGAVINSSVIVGGGGGGRGGSGGAGIVAFGIVDVTNRGSIVGGVAGPPGPGGNSGGDGGVGVVLHAGGSVTNSGGLEGGAGAVGSVYYFRGAGSEYGDNGGAGGAGLVSLEGGDVGNSGVIAGGAGGAGGAGASFYGVRYIYYGSSGDGGAGGVGVSFTTAGSIANTGTIIGGAGADAGPVKGQARIGTSGAGGAGIDLAAGGDVSNDRVVVGGAGGGNGGDGMTAAGAADIGNYGSIVGGAGGRFGVDGDGVVIQAGGAVRNGHAGDRGALIEGAVGVYAGASGAVTVTNFGKIEGTGGAAVEFKSASDRLLAEAGSLFSGTVAGGGGALELAGGTGTLTGLGATGTLSGAVSATIGGFGAYQVDGGATWTLAGSNTLTTKQRLIMEPGSALIGTIDGGGGGTLELAGGTGTITGLGATGTLSGGVSAMITGFGAYQIDAGAEWALDGANALSSSQSLAVDGGLTITNSGALSLQGTVTDAGDLILGGTGAATTLSIRPAGATFAGGGFVEMSNAAGNRIVASAAASLTNDDTITGAGTIGNADLSLVNAASGFIRSNASTALFLDTGANTIVNAGKIEGGNGTGGLVIRSAVDNTGALIAYNGSLTVNGVVSGTGTAVLAGGVMTFHAAFSQNVTFGAGRSDLVLFDSQGYGAMISGFSRTGSTWLDLKDIGFVSSSEASFNGGVLTVTDGTHTAHIRLAGSFTGSTFRAQSDGHGGTLVVDPVRATSPATPASFASHAAAHVSPALATAVPFPGGFLHEAVAMTLGRPA